MSRKYYLFYYILIIFSFLIVTFLYYFFPRFVKPQKTISANKDTYTPKYSISDFAADIYNSMVSDLQDINTFSDIGKIYCQWIYKKFKNLIFSYPNWEIPVKLSPKCSIWLNIFCKKYVNISDTNLPVNNWEFWKDISDDLDRARAIFNVLMNDYFNSKVLSIYSYMSSVGNVDEAIKIFSDKYFGSWSDICWDSSLFYLSNEERKPESITDRQSICSHPMTYNYLANTFESLISLKFHIKIINFDALKSNSKCWFDKAFSNYTSYTKNDMTIFYNILMNEYFWYSLYLNVYKFILLKKNWSVTYSWQVYLSPSLSYLKSINNSRIYQIENDLYRSLKAINLSTRVLWNLSWARPIHVAMLAYFEDIINFRKSLVRIYTPFHQLYYKLRNVEDLDR